MNITQELLTKFIQQSPLLEREKFVIVNRLWGKSIEGVGLEMPPVKIGNFYRTEKAKLKRNHITRERVRQIEARACRKLRGYFRKLQAEKIINHQQTIEETGLFPTRIVNALRKAGYNYPHEVRNEQFGKLVKVRNLGEKTVRYIKNTLTEKIK
jgi:hypothetical protein